MNYLLVRFLIHIARRAIRAIKIRTVITVPINTMLVKCTSFKNEDGISTRIDALWAETWFGCVHLITKYFASALHYLLIYSTNSYVSNIYSIVCLLNSNKTKRTLFSHPYYIVSTQSARFRLFGSCRSLRGSLHEHSRLLFAKQTTWSRQWPMP